MSHLTIEPVGTTDLVGKSSRSDASIVLRTALSIGALCMMFMGELQIFRGNLVGDHTSSFALIGVGLLLLVLNIGNTLLKQPELVINGPGDKVPPVRIRLIWLAVAIGLCAYVAWMTVYNSDAFVLKPTALWILAMIALALAVWPKRSDLVGRNDEKPFIRWELVFMVAVLLGGLAIRTIALDKVPYIMDQDEAAIVDEGAALIRLYGGNASPFIPGIGSFDFAYGLMVGAATLIFGTTLVGAHIVSALFGAFVLPVVYLFGREVFNRKVGFIAALFMLAWALHAHFSRQGDNLTTEVFFSALACYFLTRGLRHKTAINYVLAGIFVATAQLFYLGARVAPIAMVVYLVWLLIRDRHLVLSQWRQIALLVLAAFLIALPQNYWLFAQNKPVSTLFTNEGILSGLLQSAIAQGNGVQFVLNQLRDAFGSLLIGQDVDWYGPGSNLVGWIGAPLMLIGVVATLFLMWRRPRSVLPLVWGFGVILGGGALQHGAWAYERMFPATSSLALLVGLGVWYILTGISQILCRPQIIRYLLPIVGSLILVGNLAFYVFDFIPARHYFANVPNWIANRVANSLVQGDQAGRYVVLVTGYASGLYDTPMMHYYMMGTKYTYVEGTLADALSNPDPKQSIRYDRPLSFIVAPSRMNDLATLEYTFPGGRVQAVNLPEINKVLFYLYEVDQTHF